MPHNSPAQSFYAFVGQPTYVKRLGVILSPTVNRTYDIFEVHSDGSVVWRGTVSGHEDAIRKLQELAAKTTNEMRAMHLPSKTVIASINAPKP
jgi:hypothetical protein